ncbi:hypothetical protein Tco_0840496 [Tanacetum coccineum]|uniref:Uncharacterized protein n=1 Tax=Tanacetum coccineum TaxID=301880 RepID=A0ABQ5AVL1_9ASTR
MDGVDINTFTMEQYLALSQDNKASSVVKPKIGSNVNFEIKSQFMRELREDTFSRNKDEGAHDHIDWVGLNIVGLFNIPGVSKDALEDIHNFKQEGYESLYQAWERYNDLLYKCPTHDLNSHQKGPIPGMRPAEPLTAIQTMTDHSQKWHDGTTSRKMGSNNSSDGLAALVNKLDNLGRDMKNLRKVFMQSSNGGKFRVGPPGYYTKTNNRPPYGEKRQSLEELLAKHQEESARRSTEIDVWIKKLQENVEMNTRNQSASLKNLEAQIE